MSILNVILQPGVVPAVDSFATIIPYPVSDSNTDLNYIPAEVHNKIFSFTNYSGINSGNAKGTWANYIPSNGLGANIVQAVSKFSQNESAGLPPLYLLPISIDDSNSSEASSEWMSVTFLDESGNNSATAIKPFTVNFTLSEGGSNTEGNSYSVSVAIGDSASDFASKLVAALDEDADININKPNVFTVTLGTDDSRFQFVSVDKSNIANDIRVFTNFYDPTIKTQCLLNTYADGDTGLIEETQIDTITFSGGVSSFTEQTKLDVTQSIKNMSAEIGVPMFVANIFGTGGSGEPAAFLDKAFSNLRNNLLDTRNEGRDVVIYHCNFLSGNESQLTTKIGDISFSDNVYKGITAQQYTSVSVIYVADAIRTTPYYALSIYCQACSLLSCHIPNQSQASNAVNTISNNYTIYLGSKYIQDNPVTPPFCSSFVFLANRGIWDLFTPLVDLQGRPTTIFTESIMQALSEKKIQAFAFDIKNGILKSNPTTPRTLNSNNKFASLQTLLISIYFKRILMSNFKYSNIKSVESFSKTYGLVLQRLASEGLLKVDFNITDAVTILINQATMIETSTGIAITTMSEIQTLKFIESLTIKIFSN
jgi:hypothetical protein